MTAVIVGHDGAGWLPHGLDALLEQTRPVQRVVAVDTGSRDRSGSLLTGKLGQGAVFGMERSTGYATAVRRALQHKAASAPVAGSAGAQPRGRSEQVEWIWLLHDDCEPAPDALEQLLRGAAETPTAAVLGPKLKDWADRDVVLEAGLSLDTVGRRTTGIEPREVDQGQHDGDRDVLAVSSAGMLIRRDAWDQVGGFDPGMALFGEDIDLCWRVHAAGYRVRVITDAVVYHALAATRGRRAISVGRRARLLDRRNGLLTLLGNLPTGPMLISLLGNLLISLVRTVFYLVAKRGTAALDEAAAVIGVVGHPLRFAAARRRRARGRRAAYSRVRADLPAGHSVRRAAEFIALLLTRSGRAEHASGRSAIDDPDEDDSLLTDTGFLQRFVTRPSVLLVLALIIIAAVAEHSLIGGGPLGGGALLPAWEGASQLWGEVLQAFHPVGIGSASAAPPSAGFVALLATILLGKPWLAVDVLLLGCVPLAGLTALLALRRVTASAPVQVWAAASYALLPVAFGAIAAGRLGSAVVFVLIPLIGLAAGRMFTQPPRLARRAAWAAGLLVTVGTAFVPVLWPMAVVAALLAAVTMRRSRARLINLVIVAATAPVLLLPWMLQLLAHPSALLLEAGVQQAGLASPSLPARSVLLLSPGGPGLPPYWTSAALVLTGLVALLATRRRALVACGWIVALLGFATAIAVSRMTVTPAGGQPMTPWPGPALAVAAAGLLLASVAGADGVRRSLSARGRGGRRRLTGARGVSLAVLGLAAVSAPIMAGAYWVLNGVTGPVAPASSQIVPALVPLTGGAGRQLRTLVLSSSGGQVSFVLLRGDSPEFADSGLVPAGAAQAELSQAVATLVAPDGGQAANQSGLLARFDIGYVLMRAPLNAQLASTLASVPGLTGVSMTSSFDLWRLTTLPSRVSVVEPSGAVVAINSGPVGVTGAQAPAAGGVLELAEPAGGWHASLNGRALTPVPSPAGSWAQAFQLPPGSGTLSISRSALLHDLLVTLELLAFAAVAVLALPGVRTAAEIEAAAAAGTEPAQAAEEDEEVASSAAGTPAAAGQGRSHRPGRGRLASSGRGGGPGRRRAGAGPDGRGEAEPESAGRGDVSRPVRAGATRAAAGLAGRGRTAGRAAQADGAAAAGAVGGATAGAAGAGPAGAPGALRPGARAARIAGSAASAARAAGGAARGAGGAWRGPAGAAGRPSGAGALDASEAGGPDAAAGRAAWPAGQPASRFLSGPPGSAAGMRGDGSWPQDERADADDHYPGGAGRGAAGISPSGSGFDGVPGRSQPVPGRYDVGPSDREPSGRRGWRDEQPGRRVPSPSGMPYEEEPAGQWQAYPAEPAREPSSSSYYREPLRSDQAGEQRSHDAAANWRDAGWLSSQSYSAAPLGSEPPAAGPPGSGPPGSGPPGSGPRGGGSGSHGQDWAAADQPGWHSEAAGSAWSDHGQQQGWPQESQQGRQERQQGWPQEPQQGWPREQRRDYQPGRDWSGTDQDAWPGQGDALEALPPAGEVQYDWPGPDEGARRGWIAPEDETDGDTW